MAEENTNTENNELDNETAEFKAEVNKYLVDVFDYEEIPEDSSEWDAIDSLASGYEVSEENEHLLPLAYACAYVILDTDSINGASEGDSTSISVGHVSVGSTDGGESSLADKAYSLLELHGFITNNQLDVVNA